MSLEAIEHVELPLDFSVFSEIIDVRSPGEFAEDHLPGAINLPVLGDDERHEVGTLYESSPFEARRLGAALISRTVAGYLENELRDRPRDWAPLLYCWRGGMRSGSIAVILRSIGWRARVLEGGYKAWRNFVRLDLERLVNTPSLQLHILAGLTGSAKTRLLHAIEAAGSQILDLEGLANHRGSLLGGVGPQPGQKHFETRLYEALSGLDLTRPVFAEAESNRIGALHIPGPLWQRLGDGTVSEILLPLEERAAYLLDDYRHFPDDPRRIHQLVDKLRRLRGSELVDQWQSLIDAGEWTGFVRSILENHYDLVYRRPGSSGCVYQSPACQIALPDAGVESITRAAAELIATARHDP